MPVVRFPAALQRYAGGQPEIRVDGATAGAALEAVCVQHPALRMRLFDTRGEIFPYLLLFKDDTPATLTTPLTPNDPLEILTAVEGG